MIRLLRLLLVFGVLALVWAAIPLFEGRDRHEEQGIIGALKTIEAAVKASQADVKAVDVFHVPTVEPGYTPGAWKVSGVARMEIDDESVRRELYTADVRAVCELPAEIECWSLDHLVVGTQVIVSQRAAPDRAAKVTPKGVAETATAAPQTAPASTATTKAIQIAKGPAEGMQDSTASVSPVPAPAPPPTPVAKDTAPPAPVPAAKSAAAPTPVRTVVKIPEIPQPTSAGADPPSAKLNQLQTSKALAHHPRIPAAQVATISTAPSTQAPSPNGSLVFLIQRRLKLLGINPGPLDGDLGPRTSQAIQEFQRRAGLAVDGKPSRELVRRLEFTLANRVSKTTGGTGANATKRDP